jgi:hypothetical protein
VLPLFVAAHIQQQRLNVMFYYQSKVLSERFAELGTRSWLHLNKHVINLVLLIYSLIILLSIYCYQLTGNSLTFAMVLASITPFLFSSCMYLFLVVTSNPKGVYLWRKLFMFIILLPLTAFMSNKLRGVDKSTLKAESISLWG